MLWVEPMRLGSGALVVGAAVVVLVGGCHAGTRPAAPANSVANAAVARPSPTPAPPDSAGYAAAGQVGSGPPDADGNPACPVADSWGADDAGVAVSYWAHGADYVTVLLRTSRGPDVARSLSVRAGQALQLFEFPDTDPRVVREVLIITNDRRCYATVDPATFRR